MCLPVIWTTILSTPPRRMVLAEPTSTTQALPVSMSARCTRALGLISSLTTGDGAVHEVDVRNEGTLEGLSADDVVEVPARVGREGPEPLPQPPLAPELLGLVQHVAAYERLTVRAARSRDPVDARKALLAHPLIGQVELVDGLLDRLVAEAVH